MYKVFVRFTLMSLRADESIGYFKTIPECKKFINSFPNVTHWSISPLKELSPCESFGKNYSLNVRIADSSGKWKLVSNELDFADIQSEVFDNIDLDTVSEISIRIRHGY